MDYQCIAKMMCKDKPIGLLNVANQQLLLSTEKGFIYKYLMQHENKIFKKVKIFKDIQSIDMNTFTSSQDGLYFIGLDEIVKMKPSSDDKSKFQQELQIDIQLESDDDETTLFGAKPLDTSLLKLNPKLLNSFNDNFSAKSPKMVKLASEKVRNINVP